MATKTLEQRVAALEAQINLIKESSGTQADSNLPWWQNIRGVFQNDPAYDEAMRYGQEYRGSLRSDSTTSGDVK